MGVGEDRAARDEVTTFQVTSLLDGEMDMDSRRVYSSACRHKSFFSTERAELYTDAQSIPR